NRRGGTENTPAIIGFAKASEIFSINLKKYFDHVTEIKKYFLERISNYIGNEILLNSPEDNCSPYILNISLNPEKFKINSDSLLINFDMEGIAISNGSACSSGTIEPSHVLLSMGLSRERAETAMRFSFSKFTTEDEIDYAISTLKKILNRFRTLN
ncbi:MAG: aminotransferase class V-fold PLP-dependent enzyme, partial [Ignavibacteria bacterium]|nr:aminotransferase class V-fold PLP-dependent enzyme [Ignavibacteria bacterium]